MKRIFVLASVVFFITCSNNSTGPNVVNSELWQLNDVATQNYANLTLSKLSNGANSVQGSWYYTFYGSLITCKIMAGTAAINATNDSVTINANGTGSYPPDSAGHVESSGFSLLMKGLFKNGSASGNWSITFTDTTWNGWISPGQFTGTLKSGSGVTIPDTTK